MTRIVLMPKRITRITDSLKQLGDIQVTDWDFMSLMNTEIRELEIARSLRRLGNIQVMDLDFKNVLPAMGKTANKEVGLVDLFKRAAAYKVMDWDFRKTALPADSEPAPPEIATAAQPAISRSEMQTITVRLKNFLEYVVVNLIDQPERAQIKVTEMGPSGLRFKLVLEQKDVVLLIGREGFTAAAIRNLVKAAAGMHGVQALLQIVSHQEEQAFLAKDELRR